LQGEIDFLKGSDEWSIKWIKRQLEQAQQQGTQEDIDYWQNELDKAQKHLAALEVKLSYTQE